MSPDSSDGTRGWRMTQTTLRRRVAPPTHFSMRSARSYVMAAIAVACAWMIAACGSSARWPSASSRASLHPDLTAECMYSHGLTSLVSSPSSTVRPRNYVVAEHLGGLYLFVPSTTNASSPAFERAAKSCGFQ